ncbi:glycosyltransferase family 4 protein [Desulfovibrio inopinatus]|uniref:glycosyltransferase family 4 protein n=1 Tax=Desulfovibrio inopinatus TaxID=102109 RepID=UPI000404A959|nr:glycosyltransferase family 4 protein [Desulfovibrio inopinatus]
MNILFLHQNYPGQFKHLAPRLAQDTDNTVIAMTSSSQDVQSKDENITYIQYDPPKSVTDGIHPYIASFESSIRRGQNVVRQALQLKKDGFVPDIVLAHPGWGESLFIKDVFDTAKLAILCEFYYHFRGADIGFDPEFPPKLDDMFRLRIKNSTQLLALETTDMGISAMHWQKSLYPSEFQYKIVVQHEGIDTSVVVPNSEAQLQLDDGTIFSAGDNVLTFVNRNLEPYRGYHVFMRALERIQKENPDCHVLIVGGDRVSYGRKLPNQQTFKEKYLAEVNVDRDRIHFMGNVPYETYLKVLQVSRAHVYLTYPFVLSWSMLEAMSAQCLIIGSATAPVTEVLKHKKNGLLFRFFDVPGLANLVTEALHEPEKFVHLREKARSDMVNKFDLVTRTLPNQIRLLEKLLGKKGRTGSRK